MEEKQFGYKDQTLIDYYNNYVKTGKMHISSLMIDISGENQYDIEEYARFMKEYSIKGISIFTDDGKKVSELFKNIPIEQLESIGFHGKLDGLHIDNFITRGEGDSATLASFENLRSISIYHDGDGLLDLGELCIGKNVERLFLNGVGKVDSFFAHPNRDRAKGLTIDVGDQSNIDWSTTKSTSLVTALEGNEFQPTIESFNLIKKSFPNLEKIPFAQGSDLLQVDDLIQLQMVLESYGKARFTPGLMNALRYFAGKSNNERMISDLVSFPNGEYHNVRLNGINIDKEHVYEEIERAKQNQDNKPLIYGIGSLKDLSIEEALRLKEAAGNLNICISFNAQGTPADSRGTYNIDNYIEIYQKMNELLEGIDESIPEKARFAEIYRRVADSMYYDNQAAYPTRQEDVFYRRGATYSIRNLEGLLTGKTVCAGYAFILKNALDLEGIDSMIVSGPVNSVEFVKENPNPIVAANSIEKPVKDLGNGKQIVQGGHAWNKVKLDGTWYNADATWDHGHFEPGKMPSYALLSDKTLRRLGREIALVSEPNNPECKVDYPEEDLAKMFGLMPEKSNMIRFREFITGNKVFPRRKFSFDPIILDYMTGEKIADIQKEMTQDTPKNIFERMVERIKNAVANRNQEMLPPGVENENLPNSQAGTGGVIGEIKESHIWDLSKEEAKNINIQDAIDKTQKSKDSKTTIEQNKENDGISLDD